MKFVFFYFLPKIMSSYKKTKTMSQVGVQKLGVPVFLQQLSYMVDQNNRSRGKRENFRPLLASTEPTFDLWSSKNHVHVMLMQMILWRNEKFVLVEKVHSFIFLSIYVHIVPTIKGLWNKNSFPICYCYVLRPFALAPLRLTIISSTGRAVCS